MIYLFEGTETYRMNLAKREMIEKSGADQENIITIDASSTSFSLENALALCNTFSLFGDRRVVLLDQPYFLKTKKGNSDSSKKKETISTLLEEYCNNPCETTDLILYCYGFDADKRIKEYKVLSNHFNTTVEQRFFRQMSPYELIQEIDRTLHQHQIHMSKEAKQEFLDRIDGNTTQFYVAMDKILLYGEKQLELQDIEHLISANMEVNVWKFTDAFLQGNTYALMRYLDELLYIERLSYTAIIPLLSYRLRTVFKALRCQESGMRISEIEQYIGKRNVDKDIQSARGYQSHDLLGLLNELAELDQSIKNGTIQEQHGFESFLYRHLRRS